MSKKNNPGELTSTINLNAPSRKLIAEAHIEHTYDLDHKKDSDREEGQVKNKSEADFDFTLGYRLDSFSESLVKVKVDSLYRYEPDDPDPNNPDDVKKYWDDLEITFNANGPQVAKYRYIFK